MKCGTPISKSQKAFDRKYKGLVIDEEKGIQSF